LTSRPAHRNRGADDYRKPGGAFPHRHHAWEEKGFDSAGSGARGGQGPAGKESGSGTGEDALLHPEHATGRVRRVSYAASTYAAWPGSQQAPFSGLGSAQPAPPAAALALTSVVLPELQMLEMLPPALRKSDAEARATKAVRSVYSIKSWPCSSYRNARILVMVRFQRKINLLRGTRDINQKQVTSRRG
jgi:hypothetical protein